MGIVLVRTYKHSQFPYLYTCAALMFASVGFEVLGTILYNWVASCDNFYAQNDKCRGKPTTDWVANVAFF
jgi:hypothetical protein